MTQRELPSSLWIASAVALALYTLARLLGH
jgi:hypothetical protein